MADTEPRKVLNFCLQAEAAYLALHRIWQKHLADGYVEEAPGMLVKRDEKGQIVATVET